MDHVTDAARDMPSRQHRVTPDEQPRPDPLLAVRLVVDPRSPRHVHERCPLLVRLLAGTAFQVVGVIKAGDELVPGRQGPPVVAVDHGLELQLEGLRCRGLV